MTIDANAYASPHFQWRETWFTSQRDYAVKNRILAESVAPTLVATCRMMEQVRSLCGGRSISVHSMFRYPELNAHIGGSTTSQHPKGEACDFHIVGLSLREAFDTIRKSDLKWGQLIGEGHDGSDFAWIHISLGAPWRAPDQCQQVLVYDGVTYRHL